jgi:dTDP-glucose pyrophosphorylase
LKNFSKYIVRHNASIKLSISVIDANAAKVALIINDDNELAGIVTDGDIRRAILSNYSLDDPVSAIMTKDPLTLLSGATRSDALKVMRESLVHHIPVINDDRNLVDFFVLDDFIKKRSYDNPVVIMAGGKGERLKPLTNDCPKPMLKINGKPILEIILERAINSGFKNYYISVNYLKHKIKEYFNDGSKWGVSINYLEESEPLGTCGALSLLPGDLSDDIIVMNGDVVTNLDYERFLKFHKKGGAPMSICSRHHRVRIPFAVLRLKDHLLNQLVEKPTFEYQVNAGVYALSPKLLPLIPNDFYNMTDLVESLLADNKEVGVFPIHEDWTDIGNKDDFFSCIEGN